MSSVVLMCSVCKASYFDNTYIFLLLIAFTSRYDYTLLGHTFFTLKVLLHELHIPITVVLFISDPASLVTEHSYTPPSEPVIIVNSNTLLLITIIPCLLHTNMLSGPPSAIHVKLTVELKLVRILVIGVIKTLPAGDTTEMCEFVNTC